MIGLTTILSITLLSLCTFQTQADSWTDPTWDQMIQHSDVIALVEYLSEGEFRAKARPIKVYKGSIKSEKIWISKFSNRYGPIDTMHPGDRYIVFLLKYNPNENSIENWKVKSDENPDLLDFYTALKTGRVYDVWTPTSGDLKVEGNTLQYDLLQTTYYDSQKYHRLTEFEDFLKATSRSNNSIFHNEIIKKMQSDTSDINTAQHLMMLCLSNNTSYDPVFRNIAQKRILKSSFALAKVLGKVDDDKAKELLVELLETNNSIVQGEVVRQLSQENSESVGPILLSHLNTAAEDGIYPSSIMNPLMNQIDGGKVEIIKTLGTLKYKPAAKSLVPLLETKNDDIFLLTVKTLILLDNKDFIPYINKHLKDRTPSLIYPLCKIITDNNVVECKPALMEFISNHNRNIFPSYEYSITHFMGLAHFDDQETRKFLLNDFDIMLTKNDSIESSRMKDWIRVYIETFTFLKSDNARPLIYKSLFNWYGYNFDFVTNPQLFQIKKHFEDSFNKATLKILKDYEIEKVKSIAFINNASEYKANFKPSVKPIILIELNPNRSDGFWQEEVWLLLKKVRQELSSKLNIPIEQISSVCSSYYDNIEERFNFHSGIAPMSSFYQYAIELTNENDLIFLKSLSQNNIFDRDLEQYFLNKAISTLKEKLQN